MIGLTDVTGLASRYGGRRDGGAVVTWVAVILVGVILGFSGVAVYFLIEGTNDARRACGQRGGVYLVRENACVARPAD